MTCYAGKDGALSVGGTNIAMLTAWNVSQSAETLECAYMGSTWKDHKAGLLSWEGSADANFTDSDTTGAANSVVVGSEVALIFYPDNADTSVSFSGNAIVTAIENSASLGDVQTVSLSFMGTGTLTTDIAPA